MTRKLTHQEAVNRANAVHNSKYEYVSEYPGWSKNWQIKCPIHGLFEKIVSVHLSGVGCLLCSGTFQKVRKTNEQFLEEAHKVHASKYRYPEPYQGTDIPISIECPTHGLFIQRPHDHLYGQGCPACGNLHKGKNKKLDFDTLVRLSNEIYNGKYEYVPPYLGSKTKMTIICPEHGEFTQTPNNHLNEHGCPKCSTGFHISKPEIEWLDFIGVPEEQRQKTINIGIKRIYADAFDPITNTVYEFYGDYWHGNPSKYALDQVNKMSKRTFGDLYQSTIAREELIKTAGYNLVSIWESDWKVLKKKDNVA